MICPVPLIVTFPGGFVDVSIGGAQGVMIRRHTCPLTRGGNDRPHICQTRCSDGGVTYIEPLSTAAHQLWKEAATENCTHRTGIPDQPEERPSVVSVDPVCRPWALLVGLPTARKARVRKVGNWKRSIFTTALGWTNRRWMISPSEDGRLPLNL